MKELYFFVARKADGSPMFMQHQTEGESIESLKHSLISRLISRANIAYITLHKVTHDTSNIQLISTEQRDASNGFYPCYACSTITHEIDNCTDCGKPACSTHRKPHPKSFGKLLCLDCYKKAIEEE